MQLVINAGSSSLKWALFASDREDKEILRGVFDRLGDACSFVFGKRSEPVRVHDHAQAVAFLLNFLDHNRLARRSEITSVVHRVVHGGEAYTEPTLISDDVEQAIEQLSTLAPLHNPANLSGIRACKEHLNHARQVAVFDTAFHHTIREEVFLYGIPYDVYDKFKIRKYGFHGISHGYIASELASMYESVDAITCHLGSGSSITALRAGQSADTTMGFTPLDGVIMGTRSGEIDPEIPLFLVREGHYSLEEVEDMLSRKSGLLGIAGTADVRDLWEHARSGDKKARLALDMLSYRIAYFINAMRTACPQPRALVFTGGIGEHAWYVRQQVCAYLQLPLMDTANKAHKQKISAPDSPIDVLILKTHEELHMHRLAQAIL